MKKVLGLLMIFFILYFAIQVAFNYFGTGHTALYKINSYNIKEIQTQNKKNETDNYYFEITKEDIIFNFQIMDKNKGSKLIKEIKYFKNSNYECMIPIFRIKGNYTDMVCKKNDTYYYYNSIKGNDPEVDNFASKNTEIYVSSDEISRENGNLYIYKSLVKNHYMALEYYKGVYDINYKVGYKKIALYKNETYKKEIASLVGKYYVAADYDQEYDFHNFEIVNLETYAVSKITSNEAISLNSYVQGAIDNSLYIFDKSNKKQYEINLTTKEVIEIGNESKGIKIYKNKKFTTGNVYEAVTTKLIFSEYTTDNTLNNKTYSKVDKVGNLLSGYYYIYVKENNIYKVYRASIQNTNILTYLFETTNINNVQYVDNYIYYIYNSDIKYFNEKTGNQTLGKYLDIEYNANLKFYIYAK